MQPRTSPNKFVSSSSRESEFELFEISNLLFEAQRAVATGHSVLLVGAIVGDSTTAAECIRRAVVATSLILPYNLGQVQQIIEARNNLLLCSLCWV